MARIREAFRHTTLVPILVLWGFGYILVDVISYLMGRSQPLEHLIAAIPMFMLGVSLTLTLDRLRCALARRSTWLLWPVLAITIPAATMLQGLFDLYWLRWVALNLLPSWQDWAVVISSQRMAIIAILYLWTFCLALTLLWAGRTSNAADAAAARAARFEAAAAKAEATALRLQLNPHFLFNTMNSISSLVTLDRKAQAEEMIDRLSDFLRGSLNADPMADVPLSQEIDMIDSYLAIEATRFGERLTIDIDIAPDAVDAQVPNFILQPLVENAIKHGVAAIRGPATLSVRADREGQFVRLCVVNSLAEEGQSSSAPRTSTGIGLANIRQRLANRYGDAAGLETGPSAEGYRAAIHLPFVRAD